MIILGGLGRYSPVVVEGASTVATPSATVRVDTKEDTDAATTVLTRTFINDFAMNLYGCIKKRNASTDIDSRDPGVQRTAGLLPLPWYRKVMGKERKLLG
ncbi:uncharacterized protein BT62DRAFT_265519 [Guyanagaster necrorhizus]|uniref:Uncharacterized protein n=1 Tax=Guyanagaster necrorhizus TaxID=856835 RepID=A0A9P7W4G1_9AGAR|nr:uncharacterized protein BT62DRAFT_265519 [Guyanagaster necrorhizus MCA 3950]KAG7451785.1 hypothetical protein BT62DRAFT_265519 [Guyanagaster necrorhizus MCA 3950]